MELRVRENRFFFENLSFARKNEAKDLGAHWSGPRKTWISPANLITALGLLSDPNPDDDLAELQSWVDERLKPAAENGAPLDLLRNPEMPHQREGVVRTLARKRYAFWWDLGVGKTYGALWLAQILHRRGIHHVLIFCPVSLVTTWMDEMKKHLDVHYTVDVLDGSPSRRKSRIQKWSYKGPSSLRFAIASWNVARQISTELGAFAPGYLIGDETGMIKNHSAKRTKGAIQIADRCEWVVALNGTPYVANAGDLWSQMRFVGEVYAGNSYWRFANRYIEFDRSPWHRPIGVRKDRLSELKLLMDTVGMTVRKEDVLKDLPPKSRQIRWVEADGAQKKALLEAMGEFYFAVDALKKGSPSQEMVLIRNAMARAAKVQQIAMGWTKNESGEIIHFRENPKIEALLELAEETYGRKTVIFSRFIEDIGLAYAALKKAGRKPVSFHGRMNPSSLEQSRQSFTNGDADFFIAQVQKGGFGLNLQVADTAVFLTNWWSIGVREQAEGRLHRKGQKSNVFAIDIAMTQSVDEKILGALESGTDLIRYLFGRKIDLPEEGE